MDFLVNNFSLKGRTALITGSTSGIGRQMALALGMAGADLIIWGRSQEKVDATVAQLGVELDDKDVSNQISGITMDLSFTPDFEEKVTAVTKNLERIDILVNCAGINLREPWDEISYQTWDTTIAINLSIPFFMARACLPFMKKSQYGRIINIGSLQSVRAFQNSMPYGASKGGVVQLTRAMAEAWSKDGVTANAIAPGFFPTPLTQPVYENPEKIAQNATQTAIGRNGELEDFNGLTVFLASPASAYITGQTIFLDGGFTAK